MRKKILRLSKRGIAPVISSIILSAVVIAIGGAVWAYSQGASVSISKDYVEGVFGLMDEAIERFTVEHVSYHNVTRVLKVWVYNYGDIDVVVDVYANTGGGISGSKLENKVVSKQIARIDLSLNLTKGSEVAIKVVSRRGNNAYYTYLVP